MARAHGSYPWCRGFKSLSRYELERMSKGILFFAYNEPSADSCLHENLHSANGHHRAVRRDDKAVMQKMCLHEMVFITLKL